MQLWSNLPSWLQSGRVLIRFGLRLLILIAFAGFSSTALNQSLHALFWMATVLCALIAGLRRERFLDDDLNHWDEMAAYGAPCALTQALG
ncbi:hypothetical protein CQ14_30210 [Bradyrhizobium lablabi]|uniref:Uncharacterized protein n=1 Tax=Bradyrhizobium lablabi TaxID=722472 RepID=A0A0R3NAN7_9BRAD|nr:hypothetical protein [Bradyrhizobium lablabi]KRR26931.1 hypothetical protein CQ14_30210 [Bradyrhizobium lablabi]